MTGESAKERGSHGPRNRKEHQLTVISKSEWVSKNLAWFEWDTSFESCCFVRPHEKRIPVFGFVFVAASGVLNFGWISEPGFVVNLTMMMMAWLILCVHIHISVGWREKCSQWWADVWPRYHRDALELDWYGLWTFVGTDPRGKTGKNFFVFFTLSQILSPPLMLHLLHYYKHDVSSNQSHALNYAAWLTRVCALVINFLGFWFLKLLQKLKYFKVQRFILLMVQILNWFFIHDAPHEMKVVVAEE